MFCEGMTNLTTIVCAEMWSCWDIQGNIWWKLGVNEGTTHGDSNMALRWYKHGKDWL